MAQRTTYLGGCLCGWIRFEALGPAENPHTCSCTMCQRHTGVLTAAWVEFPRDRVRWTGAGAAPSTYRSSAASSRAFCGKCGSSIGAIDDNPTVALLVGCFDESGLPELSPTAHSYVDSRPNWWHLRTESSADSDAARASPMSP
jgi:hypothetical protein